MTVLAAATSLSPVAETPSHVLEHRLRVTRAAATARRMFPGAIGELLERELFAAKQFEYAMSSNAISMRCVDELLAMDLPDPT